MSRGTDIHLIQSKSGKYVGLSNWARSIKISGELKLTSDPLPVGGQEICDLHGEIVVAAAKAAQEAIDAYLPKLEAEIKAHADKLRGDL